MLLFQLRTFLVGATREALNCTAWENACEPWKSVSFFVSFARHAAKKWLLKSFAVLPPAWNNYGRAQREGNFRRDNLIWKLLGS
jgi:hypothetical protein